MVAPVQAYPRVAQLQPVEIVPDTGMMRGMARIGERVYQRCLERCDRAYGVINNMALVLIHNTIVATQIDNRGAVADRKRHLKSDTRIELHILARKEGAETARFQE